ncbi:uncharacterized protein LODBEIA_P28030 [Lodderomyces beijingensis]|uniref:Deacetylase sirtuin-type domain-containing protein n=1 Tax=Lodderomyces beijingensis TaxID=1775926 RepID=A0ABP0ZKA9_9ASCO
MWKNYNSIDLATPDAFYIDPGLVWQFYSWRRYAALKARPNRGHIALAKLSQLPQVKYISITQNVDGLSSRSNHHVDKLYEIHGSLFTLKCTSFSCNYVERNNFEQPLTPSLSDTQFEYSSQRNRKRRRQGEMDDVEENETLGVPSMVDDVGHGAGGGNGIVSQPSLSPHFEPVKTLSEDELPKCPVCKELLRPGVVWFGESLPLDVIRNIDNFIEEGGNKVDLILVIGTSGTVYPANSYVERVRYQGGKVAVFNTDIDDRVESGKVKNTWGFKGDAAELLPTALEPLIGKVEMSQ